MANFKDGKFSFETKKLLGWYYVVKWRVAGDPFVSKIETINGWAKLYMPASIKEKVPVVILIHGSGGLFTRDGRERYMEYVEDLLKNNIGVAMIDVYGPRTSGNMIGASTRFTWDAIYDAYRVRALLRTHPNVDPDKIGIGGFSMGGQASYMSYDKRVGEAWADDGQSFAFYAPIYPSCTTNYMTWKSSGKPMLMQIGELDEYTGAEPCIDAAQKFKDLGLPVRSVVYKGAYHAWDSTITPMPLPGEVSAKNCRWWLYDGSGWRNARHELLNTPEQRDAYFKECTINDPRLVIVGRNEEAFRNSRADLVNFIKANTK